MTATEIIIEPKSKSFGVVGVIAAFLGLISVLVGPVICDALIPPPPVEKQLAHIIVSVKQHIAAKLKKTPALPEAVQQRSEAEQERVTILKVAFSFSLALASLAIICGVVSYLRREDHRYAYAACGIATVTLVWHALLLALAVIVLCAIIFGVLSNGFP